MYKIYISFAVVLIFSFSLSAQQDNMAQLHKDKMIKMWQEVHPELNIVKLSDVDSIYDDFTNAQILSIDLKSYQACLEHRAERIKVINTRVKKHENARSRIRKASQEEFDEMMRNPDDEIRAMIEDKDKQYYIPETEEEQKSCAQFMSIVAQVTRQ